MIVWRPNLFSATGAQFQSEAILNDGIHLRWMIDPRMGLPFEKDNRQWGAFRIYQQISKCPCLDQFSIDEVKSNTTIPVHEKSGNAFDFPLETRLGFIYFLRTNQLLPNLAAEKLLNQIRSLIPWNLSQEQIEFVNYLKTISKQVRGETVRSQPFIQRAEVCAIDLRFETGTGTVPGDNGSGNAGCLGILNAFAEKKYLWVRAYDKRDHLLAEDWIGRFAFTREHIANPSLRNKFSVRFRAAGIHHISIVPIAGAPVMNRLMTQWIFCEEYCNAGVWNEVGEPNIRFNGNKQHYTPTVVEQRYYSGFKTALNWPASVSLIQNEVLGTAEMEGFLQVPDTYQEYKNAIALQDNDPSPGSHESGSLPLLPALLHAATDPTLASLLGLYFHLPDQPSVRDIRIVADLPFFEERNLTALHEQFRDVVQGNGVPFLVDEHLGYFNPAIRFWVQLGGLVLNPFKGIKPPPPAPSTINTSLHSIDLPGDSGTVLLADSVIKIPVPPASILPYQHVESYEVHRKIGEGDFVNSADDEVSSALLSLGILPPVYFPSRLISGDLTVRDSFVLTIPPDQTVQYRARSFDIFGRPGEWRDDIQRNIPIPCHPPLSPSILSATVLREGQRLFAELILGISGKHEPFQAVSQRLELSLHSLAINANGPAGDIQWTGELAARGLRFDYGSGENYPDLDTGIRHCLQLRWNADKAEWDNDPLNACSSIYPDVAHSSNFINDPSIDEVLLEYRTCMIRIALANINSLAEGEYRWCARARIKGTCTQGDTVFSKESCTSMRYNHVLPPPLVIQPPATLIPNSTYPDKTGNSYYTFLLNPLLQPVPSGQVRLVNVYLIDLKHLSDELSSLVDGELLLSGADAEVFRLAHKNKSVFKRLNQVPVPVADSPSHYSAVVEGTLENYFVLGIVGVNDMAQESSWSHAAILIFKTPRPLPKPKLRFIGILSEARSTQVISRISFRADYETAVIAITDQPRLQVMRHDKNTGRSQLAGQVNGQWNEAGNFYQFDFKDERLTSWRHYQYEAILVTKVGEKWVKSEERAVGETTAPGTSVPLDGSFFAEVTSVAGGNRVKFAFSAGDFDLVLVRRAGDIITRLEGKVRNMTISGISGASVRIQPGTENFLLEWIDTAGGSAEYTLRLFRGQQAAWTNKLIMT